jgi:hypothetical protein
MLIPSIQISFFYKLCKFIIGLMIVNFDETADSGVYY